MGSSENPICMPKAINRPGLFLGPRNIANRDAVAIVAIHRNLSRHLLRFIAIGHTISPNATLETLVDTSPNLNDEYALCYIKADNLLNDYIAFKEVSISIVKNNNNTTVK